MSFIKKGGYILEELPPSHKTKVLLGYALKKHMNNKPLERITIQEIVNECQLNRRTFYYHFRDIYELLEWVYKEDALNQLEIYNSYHNWREGLLHLFNYLTNEGKFLLSALCSLEREHLEKYMYAVTYRVTREIVNEISCDLNVQLKDKDFVAHYYTISLVGIVSHWLRNGMKEDPDHITEQVLITVEGSMRQALERFAAREQ